MAQAVAPFLLGVQLLAGAVGYADNLRYTDLATSTGDPAAVEVTSLNVPTSGMGHYAYVDGEPVYSADQIWRATDRATSVVIVVDPSTIPHRWIGPL